MTVAMGYEVIVAITEDKAVSVGIVAPFGRGGSIMAVMVAFVDTLGAAGADWFAMGRCSRL